MRTHKTHTYIQTYITSYLHTYILTTPLSSRHADPSLKKSPQTKTQLDYVIRGFPLGFVAPSSLTGELNDEYFLYNHLRITVLYHSDPSLFSGLRIVGFEVVPFSVNHRWQGDENDVENLQLDTCTTINPADNDPSNFMKLR